MRVPFRDLYQSVLKGEIGAFYFLGGEEEYFKTELLTLLKEKLTHPYGNINFISLDCGETSLQDVLTHVAALPMLAPRQLIFLREWDSLTAKKQTEFLEQADIQPTTCLLLTGAEYPAGKLAKELEKRAMAVSCVTPKGERLMQWISYLAKKQKKKISPAACSYLEHLGGTLLSLEKEIEKIVLWIGEKEEIQLADAEAVVSTLKLESIFALNDAFSGRNGKLMLKLFRDLVDNGVASPLLLSLLHRQLRQLWKVKMGDEEGVGTEVLRKQLGLPSFVIEKLRSDSRRWHFDELGQLFQKFAEIDYQLKTSSAKEDAFLASLLEIASSA